ncbi:GtrA family protein [Candidatus Saccharibacteria bacterium]|nr:GtrA family protein [Candidatus Saccharibacteria bacterium]
MQEKLKKLESHPFYKKHGEKIKFVLVGGFNTVLDFCIFGLLANIIGIPKEVANIISTTICIAISFILNYKFVWKSKKSKKETAPGFVIVSLFSAWIVQNIAINMITLPFGENSVTKLIGKAFGSICGMISNYFGYKLIFRGKNKKTTSRRRDEEPKQQS